MDSCDSQQCKVDLTKTDVYDSGFIPDADNEVALKVLRTLYCWSRDSEIDGPGVESLPYLLARKCLEKRVRYQQEKERNGNGKS